MFGSVLYVWRPLKGCSSIPPPYVSCALCGQLLADKSIRSEFVLDSY